MSFGSCDTRCGITLPGNRHSGFRQVTARRPGRDAGRLGVSCDGSAPRRDEQTPPSDTPSLRPRPRPVTAQQPAPLSPARNEPPARYSHSDNDTGFKRNLRINIALAKAGSLHELFDVIRAEHQHFNQVNAITALHRIAKHSVKASRTLRAALRDHELVQIVCYQVVQTRTAWPGRTVCSVAYASAVLGFHPEYLLSKAVEALPAVVEECRLLDISLVLWACVKSNYNPPGFFQDLAPVLTRKLRTESCIEEKVLCRIPWACASLDEFHAELFREVAPAARAHIEAGHMRTPQALSLLLWAYGRAIPPAGDSAMLLSTVSDEVLGRPQEFNWQDLANICWAAARISASQSRSGVSAFIFTLDDLHSAPVTSKTVQLFGCVSRRVQRLMQESVHASGEQSIANIAWAFATLSIQDSQLFDCLADQALRLLDQFTPQALSNLVWACGRAGHQHAALFEACAVRIANQAERGAAWGGDQDVAQVVWSYAALNNVHSPACRRMFVALGARAEALHNVFNAGSVSAVLWSFAIAQHLPQPLLAKLWARAAALVDELSPSDLGQLAQVQLVMELDGRSPVSCVGLSTDAHIAAQTAAADLAARTRRSLRHQLNDGERNVSSLQQDVMAEFRQLRLPVVMEHTTRQHSLDIAWPEQRLAIEVDGPSHFTSNTLEPTGATLFKRRLLARAGWRLVSIPFHEWTRLRSRAAKQVYIAQTLEAAGMSVSELTASAERQQAAQQEADEGAGGGMRNPAAPAAVAAHPSSPADAMQSAAAAAAATVAAATEAAAASAEAEAAIEATAAAVAQTTYEVVSPAALPFTANAAEAPAAASANETHQQQAVQRRALRLAAPKDKSGQLSKEALLHRAQRAARLHEE